MKKILVIADGALSKHFLRRLFENRSNLHHYMVVSKNSLSDLNINAENFSFHEFDPTSKSKLSVAVQGYFSQFMIVCDDKDESVEIYKNLREISKTTDIILCCLWSVDEWMKEDRHIEFVDAKEILASRLIHHLPDMPAYADNIGFGEGEIMEVKVPIGSSYMYRHLSQIQQRKWKIALIYRQNEIILPSPSVMIRPNDTLLTVGDPNVLRNVFRSIKREKGQFPNPFGNNIYTFIDMKKMSKQRVAKLIEDSLMLHSKLNNKRLIIKVVNPTLGANLRLLKSIDDKNITVMLDYFVNDNSHIAGDTANYDIGLIVTDNKYFFAYKKLFYQLFIPVLKIGTNSLLDINEGVIVTSGDENIESQSAVILDCCSQMGIGMKLFYYDSKNSEEKAINEHFESLNTLFEKNIDIQNVKDKNPLLELSSRTDLLHFVSFDESIVNFNFFRFLSLNLNKQYKTLSENAQLFIPIEN